MRSTQYLFTLFFIVGTLTAGCILKTNTDSTPANSKNAENALVQNNLVTVSEIAEETKDGYYVGEYVLTHEEIQAYDASYEWGAYRGQNIEVVGKEKQMNAECEPYSQCREGSFNVLYDIRSITVLDQSVVTQAEAQEVAVQEFSDDAYTIYFAKDGRGPMGDGSQFEIYSVQSDGSGLTLNKTESSQIWEEKAFSYGIVESMNKFYGDFESPAHDKIIVVESGGLFSDSKIFLEESRQKNLLPELSVNELEWLPDGKRIAFSTGEKIGIIDTEAGKFGYLANGAGWIVVE